jgi:hypothetical protein
MKTKRGQKVADTHQNAKDEMGERKREVLMAVVYLSGSSHQPTSRAIRGHATPVLRQPSAKDLKPNFKFSPQPLDRTLSSVHCKRLSHCITTLTDMILPSWSKF